MGIRNATLDDVPRILELGAALHAESPRWARIPFIPERAAVLITNLIQSDDGVIFVVESHGIVIGGICGIIEHHWASDARIAHELSFFLDKEHRGGTAACRLIEALKAWAKMKHVAWLHAGTSTGVNPELTAKLYERMGFERCAIGLEVYLGH